MNLNTRIKIAIAAMMVAFMGVFVASPASAADVCSTCFGSWISVVGGSNGRVYINNESYYMNLWEYQISQNYANFRDVDNFWVPGGCDAYSQWGYRYVGNAWYGPLNDSVGLKLKVIC